MIRIYECEMCGLQFDDYELCYKHERDDHLSCYCVKKELGSAQDNPKYPEHITVSMSDNSTAKYRFVCVVEAVADGIKAEPEVA